MTCRNLYPTGQTVPPKSTFPSSLEDDDTLELIVVKAPAPLTDSKNIKW